MTTTVRELLKNLKDYPEATLVRIKDVDDQEFVIVDFSKAENTLTIVIGDKVEEEEEEV
ncbi:hypothetical protein [Nostoc sp.]|uniref:hypothetical protein n=1 Tax=Nostoc sp. TaxID=1180 RepID=UPI002FFC0DB5